MSYTVEHVDLYLARLPLVRPFTTSSHTKDHLEHIIVRLRTADGAEGWGECASPSDPYYCPETTETCWHILKDFLAPAVLGRDWSSVDELANCYRLVKGNNFAKAGLEMAAWDLLGRAEGKSVAALLGGTRAEIVSGVSLGIERDGERLYRLIDQYLAEGYRRIKLKIAPGADVYVVRAVRAHYPDVPLQVDANSAYTLQDIDTLKALDEFGLLLIEQPLAHDDIIDHARLQAELTTPVCLDESIHSAEDARKALDLGSCRIINIKVSRLGGLGEARRVHDLCHARGVPVWCGGMHEYGIGRAHNIALSALPNFSIPGDISASDKYYAEDLIDPPVTVEHGQINVPQTPGLGYTPNEERITRFTVEKLTLT